MSESEDAAAGPGSNDNPTDVSTDGSDAAEPANPLDTWEQGGREFVTVRKGGQLAPNSTVHERYFDDVDGVKIGTHHEREDTIGIMPVEDFDENNDEHMTLIGDDGQAAMINCRGFLKANGFSHDESTRYVPEWDDEFGVLWVDLSAEGEVATQNTDETE